MSLSLKTLAIRTVAIGLYVLAGWITPATLTMMTRVFGPNVNTPRAIDTARARICSLKEMDPDWFIHTDDDLRAWILTTIPLCVTWANVTFLVTDILLIALMFTLLQTREPELIKCIAHRSLVTSTVLFFWAIMFHSPIHNPLTFNWDYFATLYPGVSLLWYHYPPSALPFDMTCQTLLFAILYGLLRRLPHSTVVWTRKCFLINHWLWVTCAFAVSRPDHLWSGLIAIMWTCLVCYMFPLPPLPPPSPPPPPLLTTRSYTPSLPRPIPIPPRIHFSILTEEEEEEEVSTPLMKHGEHLLDCQSLLELEVTHLNDLEQEYSAQSEVMSEP